MNFHRLWENMNIGEEPKQEVDDSIISIIKTGIGVNETFWDDFISVLNNSEGLSALFDVPVEKISTWRKKIKAGIKAVEDKDGKLEINKNKKMIKTGESV